MQLQEYNYSVDSFSHSADDTFRETTACHATTIGLYQAAICLNVQKMNLTENERPGKTYSNTKTRLPTAKLRRFANSEFDHEISDNLRVNEGAPKFKISSSL